MNALRTPEMGEFVTKIDIISPIHSLENINDSPIAREKRKVMEMWLQKSNSLQLYLSSPVKISHPPAVVPFWSLEIAA